MPHPPAKIDSLDFWRYPIVTHEINRLPRVLAAGSPAPSFNSVWILPNDNRQIWIAGDKGLLLHSDDGGMTWIQLPSGAGNVTGLVERPAWHLISIVEAESTKLKTPQQKLPPAPNQESPQINSNARLHFPLPQAPTPPTSEFDNGTDCSFAGFDLIGVYFASPSSGDVDLRPLHGGIIPMCHTTDGGRSWKFAARTDLPVFSCFSVSGSFAAATPTLPNCSVTDVRNSTFDAAASTIVPIIAITDPMLRAVHFSGDLVGVAVGSDGLAIKTIDGGSQWFLLFQGPDARHPANFTSLKFPAPWYYISWIVVCLIATPALRKPEKEHLQTEETIANMGVSDRPLGPTDADALGYRNLALSVSRFLRNENTVAPITLAVTGDWGTGKSSIMNLLRRDLASRGFRPIWFNAWHNQTEDDLFATILQAIRKQGVPQWWDLDYLPFRIRLLFKRWSRRWPAVTLLLAAIAFFSGVEWIHLKGLPIATFFTPYKDWSSAIEAWKPAIDSLKKESLHGTFWTFVFCIIVAVRELFRALKAFGVDPASLLAAKSGITSLADLEKQTSLRQRFAEELADVTESLGNRRRMVLFIDDLDRCMPENIRVLFEAINFIVTSGECYIILGLARRPVEAGIGLSFEEVAAEMTWSLATHDESADDLAKRKRWQFARQYLDKLINIEIPARPASNAHFEELVTGRESSGNSSSALSHLISRALNIALPVFVSLALIAATCTAGLLIGRVLEKQSESPPAVQTETAPAVSPSTTEVGSPSLQQQPASQSTATFSLERPASITPSLATYSLPLLALAVFLYVGWRILSQQDEVLVKDSPAFRHALEIWDTLIVQTHSTPRSTKRFMNRVRCLAMRLRPFTESRSRWKVLLQSADAVTEDTLSASTLLPESMLVALSAMYDVAPEIIRSDALYAQAVSGQLVTLSVGEVEIDERIQKTYAEALKNHRDRFVVEWPPSLEQRALFLNMSADVTVRG